MTPHAMSSSGIAAEAQSRLSRKGRIALGLALGERAFAAWDWATAEREHLQAAMEKSWSRLETGAPVASDIYQHMEPLIELNSEMADSPRRAATTTVANAVYYLLWLAFSEEVSAGRIALNQVPSELFDGGDHMMFEVLEAFEECGRPDAQREARELLDRLAASAHAQQPSQGVRELLLA